VTAVFEAAVFFSLLKTLTLLRCTGVSYLTQLTNIYYSLYGSVLVERRCVCCCFGFIYFIFYFIFLKETFIVVITAFLTKIETS